MHEGMMHGEMGKMKEMMMMKEKIMMKEKMMKEIMEHLSEEDKKKLAAMKLEMKIAMMEQKMEMMKDKKRLYAAKFDMKASMLEQKTEIMKTMRDMLKSKM